MFAQAMARHIPLNACRTKVLRSAEHIGMTINPGNNIPWHRVDGLRHLGTIKHVRSLYTRYFVSGWDHHGWVIDDRQS